MKIPRISNPEEFVEVTFTDFGDVRAVYDKEGKPHDGYTSQYEWDGKVVKSYVYRSDALKSGNPEKYRFEQDVNFLKKHDLDLDMVIWE